MDSMQDYISLLLNAINNYDPNNERTINTLRDLVCWISDDETLKKNELIAELLYIASQKMRVFGYNKLNKFQAEPIPPAGELGAISAPSVTNLYRSKVYSNNILDKTQQEVVELYQALPIRRLLVSAPTSYGKTFLMREIVFLNKARYNNILLVFPTVALLLENARMMEKFVSDNNLEYKIFKTVDTVKEDNEKKIFVFTPERALQLIATYPNLKIDFFFFDEVYKIDEDYCNDDSLEETNNKSLTDHNFLNEDRGKTFRIALYLLAKTVKEYYLAGPNLSQDKFSLGMRRFLELNRIEVKEINFEPTLRISVNAFSGKIEEKLPQFLPSKQDNALVPTGTKVNDKIATVVSYIGEKNYGKTLLYCKSPGKAVDYSVKLADRKTHNMMESYPDDFKTFIDHIKQEYDIDHSVEEWSLIQVLEKGFGIHHGKLPKYIQQEILDQFNKGTFDILFCTSTIVEGVNTDAQNMIILNPSKGTNKLTPFDIKNIKGRAGRYYHCFVGRVFYMHKDLEDIEKSDSLSLDFITYSSKALNVIDLDNADIEDLVSNNKDEKNAREEYIRDYIVPNDVFIKNRTVSRENQEKLARTLFNDKEFSKYSNWITYTIDVENFLNYRWISKILETFSVAGLIDKKTQKKFSAIANSYYAGGFKAILKFEIDTYKKGNHKSIDEAYSCAFNSRRDILEHKIPKILSLFDSIITFVAQQKGMNVDSFSLAKVRRYYETGVKTTLGEALIEYGFPTDAVRRIEESHKILSTLSLTEAKVYCRQNYSQIKLLFDKYELVLFTKAMNTF